MVERSAHAHCNVILNADACAAILRRHGIRGPLPLRRELPMLPLFSAAVGYTEGMTTRQIAFSLNVSTDSVRTMAVLARDSLFQRALRRMNPDLSGVDPITLWTSISGYTKMLQVISAHLGMPWEELLTPEEQVEAVELRAYYRASRNSVNFKSLTKENHHVVQDHNHARGRNVT